MARSLHLVVLAAVVALAIGFAGTVTASAQTHDCTPCRGHVTAFSVATTDFDLAFTWSFDVSAGKGGDEGHPDDPHTAQGTLRITLTIQPLPGEDGTPVENLLVLKDSSKKTKTSTTTPPRGAASNTVNQKALVRMIKKQNKLDKGDEVVLSDSQFTFSGNFGVTHVAGPICAPEMAIGGVAYIEIGSKTFSSVGEGITNNGGIEFAEPF